MSANDPKPDMGFTSAQGPRRS